MGVANLVPTIKRILGFKRIVSCRFRDKRMRLKTRAYGIHGHTIHGTVKPLLSRHKAANIVLYSSARFW